MILTNKLDQKVYFFFDFSRLYFAGAVSFSASFHAFETIRSLVFLVQIYLYNKLYSNITTQGQTKLNNIFLM